MIEAGAAGVHLEDQLASERNVDTLEVKYYFQHKMLFVT